MSYYGISYQDLEKKLRESGFKVLLRLRITHGSKLIAA